MTEAKLVCSPYVNIIEHKKKKIAFHALKGNPIEIDDNVEQLLLELRNSISLKQLLCKSEDYLSALKELSDIGFILTFGDQKKEYYQWREQLFSKSAADQVFSGGIIFLLTTHCNLNCSYCICSESLKKKQNMTSKTAHAILEWYLPYLSKLENAINPLFIFTGGEPVIQISLLQEIIEFIESRISYLRPHYRVISNGTLFTRQIVDYFEHHNVDLIVSIDGDQETHNFQRPFADGKPTWTKIWDGISLFSRKYRNNNLSISTVYKEEIPYEDEGVLLKKMMECGIYFWTLNINNLVVLKNPEVTARRIIALRQIAQEKYGILVSGRWATPAANMRAGNRFNAICSASVRNRIFFQPDGSITFCDYDPRIIGNINEIGTYIDKVNREKERYFFGNWKGCENCMLSGFCSPCVLEEEVLHSENPDFQKQKCLFLKECAKLLLFE